MKLRKIENVKFVISNRSWLNEYSKVSKKLGIELFGVKINKSVPGVYMIDEDDYDKKLSGGSEVAKKRHLPKKQQQAMQAAKAKKNS